MECWTVGTKDAGSTSSLSQDELIRVESVPLRMIFSSCLTILRLGSIVWVYEEKSGKVLQKCITSTSQFDKLVNKNGQFYNFIIIVFFSISLKATESITSFKWWRLGKKTTLYYWMRKYAIKHRIVGSQICQIIFWKICIALLENLYKNWYTIQDKKNQWPKNLHFMQHAIWMNARKSV